MALYSKIVVFFSLFTSVCTQALVLTGAVKDENTLLPVSGVKVELIQEGVSTLTNSAGEYTLAINVSSSNKIQTLTFSKDIYWTQQRHINSLNQTDTTTLLQAKKNRLVITTDIGGADPDDLQSLLHALLLSNEFDLQAIIYGHAWDESDLATGKRRIESAINAYERVYSNLQVHDKEYPTPGYLRSIVKPGQRHPRMEGTGEGKDSEGSNFIIDIADRDDPRPVWLNAWGGANTIAQAFWKVKASRSGEEVNRFVNKMRVYDILGQDGGGSWIAKTFPNVFYIRNAGGVYGWAPTSSWTAQHVQSHGPIGKVYPTAKWAIEGDSPSFLHISSRGLNNPDALTQGGWGGRFYAEKKTGVKLFSWAEKHPIVSAYDKTLRPYALYTNAEEGVEAIKKWRTDIHNSLAARMDWTVTSNYSDANHFPLAVLNGDTTKQLLSITVKAGDEITLSSIGSSDPDGDALTFAWLFYKEASSYKGALVIRGREQPTATLLVPEEAVNMNLHVILVARDSGTPSLASYRRVILNVTK